MAAVIIAGEAATVKPPRPRNIDNFQLNRRSRDPKQDAELPPDLKASQYCIDTISYMRSRKSHDLTSVAPFQATGRSRICSCSRSHGVPQALTRTLTQSLSKGPKAALTE